MLSDWARRLKPTGIRPFLTCHAILLGLAFCSASPTHVCAQDGEEEIIEDPDEAGSQSWSEDDGEEIIEDPEDSGRGPGDFGWGQVLDGSGLNAESSPSVDEDVYEQDPMANTGLAKLELSGQFAWDLHQESLLEDVYELKLRFGGEVELRRSRKLRLVVGSRIDFFWGIPGDRDKDLLRDNRSPLDEDRFEIDVLPTAAYAAVTVGDGMHLRVGQQVLSMGRMDFVSGADMLSIVDARPGAVVDPAGTRLAQPAVRFDWDLGGMFTLQSAYVPWFQPNLSRPNRDKFFGKVIAGPGATQAQGDSAKFLDASFETKMSEDAMRFQIPVPDFTTPQAAVRLVMRTSHLEIGLTAGSALEKSPFIYSTPELNAYLQDPLGPFAECPYAPGSEDAVNRCQPCPDDPSQTCFTQSENEGVLKAQVNDGQTVADVEHPRYEMLALDLGFEVGPVALGFEFSYSPERQLYAARPGGQTLPLPNTTEQITPLFDPLDSTSNSNFDDPSIRKGVPIAQGVMHMDWMRGESLIIGGEAFWRTALEQPYDKSRYWLGYTRKTASQYGAAAGITYLLKEGTWRFDMTGLYTNGFSLMVAPHIGWRMTETLFLDLGAILVEGTPPSAQTNGSSNTSVGGVLSGYDQFYLGVRWLP